MGIGAVFILLIVVIALAVLGAAFYGVYAWLRHLKLDPERDKLEEGLEDGSSEPGGEQPHPRHIRHGRSQRARFIGTR